MKAQLQKYGPVLAIVAIASALPALLFLFSGQLPGNWGVFSALISGSPVPNTPYDILQSDACLQFYLWRDLVFESWRHFEIPTWNPYVLGGAPLLANSQSGALYPPHILVGILQIPTTLGMNLLNVFHQMVFGLGMFAVLVQLCRESEHKQIWAATGAITASLSMFMLQWMALPSVGSTLAWFPWILVGMLQFLEGCRHWRAWIFVGLGSCLMILGGHLQFAAYGFIGAAVWGLSFCAANASWKNAWKPVIAVIFGVLLSWPQLGKVLEYSQESHRRAPATAEGWQAYSGSAAEWGDFSYLFNPIAEGSMREPLSDKKIDGIPFVLPSFMPALAKPWKNTADLAINISPILFVAILFGIRANIKTVLPGVVVALLGLLLILPSPVLQAMYFTFPGWSATGSPGRSACLIAIGVILAGIPAISSIKFDGKLPSLETPLTNQQKGTGCALLFLATIVGFSWMFFSTIVPYDLESNPLPLAIQFKGIEQSSGNVAIGILLMVTTIWAFIAMGYKKIWVAPTFIIGMAVFGWVTQAIPSGAVPTFEETTFPNERVAYINSQPNFLQNPKNRHLPNLPALNRTMIINGYDSLISRDTVEMLREINGEDPAALVNGNMILIKKIANLDALKEAGVTVVIDKNGTETRIPGPGIVSLDGIPVKDFRIERKRVFVNISGPGKLTVRMRNIRGWQAKVNGADVPIPSGRWIVLDLSGGEKKIELVYAP